MRTASSVIAVVLAAAAFAGCVATNPADEEPPVDPAPEVPPLYDGYPPGVEDPFLEHSVAEHADPTLHAMEFGMELLFHHALGGNLVRSSGAHVVEVRGGWLFVGTYGMVADGLGGVWIFDIATDPENPVLVGEFHLPGNLGGDRSLEATEDAQYLVLGTEAVDCAGHVNPFAPGLYLVDVRQKGAPLIVDYIPGTGVHSVTVHRIGGDDYVFALMGGDNVIRIDRSGPVAQFVPVGSVSIGHDSTAYDDPWLEAPVLLVAGGGGSLGAYDVSDPSAPVELGRWVLEEGYYGQGYSHAVEPYFADGKRFLVTQSEDWDDAPSPVWVLDAEFFESMFVVGTWSNPGGKPANGGLGQSLAFSTHNPRVENGIVYLAHYHAGVFALDISTPEKREKPQIAGYHLPHVDTGIRPMSSQGALPIPNALCGFDISQVPNVFDVEVKDGIVYAADLHTGLYALRLSNPSPSPAAAATP